MTYTWIITHQYIGEPEEVGIVGPMQATFSKNEILKGKAFKMKDADGELVYRGRIIGSYNGFEPLDDFGAPNAGATEIWYFEKGKWEEL